MSDPALRRVAEVLEQVLIDFGRRVAEDPRCLRGLVSDTLGAETSELQEASENVVTAAKSGLLQGCALIRRAARPSRDDLVVV